VTIHGLEYEYFPQYYSWFSRRYLAWSTRYATKHAIRIITVSENTKKDLIKLYKADPRKITVIYHGIEKKISNSQFPISNQSSISNFQFLNSKYFLYLGRIELKKNVLGIIKAFEKLKTQNSKLKIQDYKLVLAGGAGYGFEKVKSQMSLPTGRQAKFKEDIIFTGHIKGDDKWQLLKNAEALIFPSFYEGFGLPILEAQSVGVPVITSKGSSMEEITTLMKNEKRKRKNDNEKCKIYSAILVDPYKPEEIASAMEKIISDDKLRNDLIQAGYENVKRFSWKKTAQKTLKILNYKFL
jgi:glycosyltransferase involved in cell wall biosynthesis